MNTTSIKTCLEGYPKANLLQSTVVIHKLPRLSSYLGYNIYILRDDLTGFALGGNKTRKLDYLVADAVAKKADTLITKKASSFSRNAAAAGKVCGLDVHVLILGNESGQNPASQSFFKQYDTKLHYVTQEESFEESYHKVIESLHNQGKVVYELHPGGSDSIGALGYVDAFDQIMDYSRCSSVQFSNMLVSTGSTGTQVGLVIGQCIGEYNTNVIGISAACDADTQYQRVRELAQNTAQMLGVQVDESKITVDDHFIGPGYAIPSDQGQKAVWLFSSMEGILLDQVYTGKAAAALLHYASNKMFKGDNVLFIHTGGNSGMYY